MIATILEHWMLHPLNGRGYQFYSGFGSSINEWLNTLILVAAGVGAWWKTHNCHVHKCWRWSWHVSKDHKGHPVCKYHHADHPRGGGEKIEA